jgi:L-rhamnose-H+ transport protein
MGETQMGIYKFSSWTLHMASIIIFSSLWGIALREWSGAGRRTKGLLALSLALLVSSTMIVGYGNYLGTHVAQASGLRNTRTHRLKSAPPDISNLSAHW